MKWELPILLLSAYLLGAFPWGVLIGRLYGVDLLSRGSGNIGFTNAFRTLGWFAGVLVLLGDFTKGWLAVYLPFLVLGESFFLVKVACGTLALLGNSYSIFLRFRGGKAVTTSAGVILALTPPLLPIVFTIWLVLLLITRYVSLSSLVAAVALPVTALLIGEPTAIVLFMVVIGILVFWRHRENIKRLLSGTESRFEFRKKRTSY